MNALVCRFLLRLGIAPVCAFSAAVLQILVFSFNSTLAQELKPIADDTLGAESSVVTPTSPQADRIDGGAIRGANLFHSFSQFNIGEGREAYFANPSGIENILSRVTGGDASRIFGKLGVLGNANLFLINPNGIIFGKNASLDVRGSFVGTTANAIAFGNQGFFSADNPNTPALLTVNPSALLFNQIRAASIENNSIADSGFNPSSAFTARGLRVPDGKSLLLVGGDIKMDGGRLYAFGGRVELGGLASAGTVELNGDGNNSRLSFPNSVERSNVSLSNGAIVAVTGDGGSIAVNARNLEMTAGSYLFAGIESRLGSNNSKAGNISVNATGVINLNNRSLISNLVLPEANGQGGDVNISANTLRVEGGALVSTSTSGAGKGGNLTVDAQDVQLIGRSADGRVGSGLYADAANSTGDAGDLTIKTNTLLVRDGAAVRSNTSGSGKGGSLTVDASDVQLIGRSADGGVGGGLSASTLPSSTGDAGDLTIKTNTLLVRDGAQVSVSTFGSGKGGSLTVDASDVQLIGRRADGRFPSGLFASADPNSTGDAGNLTIKTNTLLVRNGAQVSASTSGSGKGGSLRVDASDVQLIGRRADGRFPSGLFASADPNSTGDAGDLTIKTNTLLVRDGAAVTVQSLGTGTAGNMTVNARSIRLNNNAILTANTQSTKVDPNREQATININSQDLIISRNSNIRTNATGENVIGGNINIDTDFLIASENSDISANSANFRGGNVRINAQGIFGTQFRDVASDRTSDITATGASPEFSGNVEINTPDIDPNSALINLPTVPIDTKLAQSCNSPNYAQSSFIITGRGGLPPNPKDILTPDAVQVDWVTLNPEIDKNSRTNISTNPNTTTPAPIVEATSWVFGPKGEVIFTAQAPTQQQNSWQTSAKCHEK
jgi:filamentous hemagglutinin family protein